MIRDHLLGRKVRHAFAAGGSVSASEQDGKWVSWEREFIRCKEGAVSKQTILGSFYLQKVDRHDEETALGK